MKIILATCFIFWGFIFTHAQKITINGFVKDDETQEVIIGATIYAIDFFTGTTTNDYGYFTLSIPHKDTITLMVSYLGYTPKAFKIIPTSNQTLQISLSPASTNLEEVVITGNTNNDNIKSTQMSVIDVPLKAILSLPAIGGERDILKIIQLLPGVQAGQEGTTGYFVRGGNLDQNLVQLDEATVYNPNHLFGLFSTFNVNAINNVKLIKGGFPAEYGGRLSSILDIHMKEGDNMKYHIEGGVGLLSDNITMQGPIQKGKSSFIVSGRKTHVNLLIKNLISASSDYSFYDMNAKMNFSLGSKDRLFFSFFKGNDHAGYSAANSLAYATRFGNSTGTLRWNHLAGNKSFINTSVIYNDYHLALSTEQNSFYSSIYTGIKDITAKTEWTYSPNTRHKIKSGIQFTHHTINPAAFSDNIPKKGKRIQIQKDSLMDLYSKEVAWYASDEINISNRLGLDIGLRVPGFIISDKAYFFIEPRLSFRFTVNENTSLKSSYSVMNQFLHLIPNATAGLPTDIWLPSSVRTKPQNSAQAALGIFKNNKQNTIEASAEIYYKSMRNQALFQEGNQLKLNNNLDSSLVYGSGNSFGIEFLIKKNEGRFNGWISYTLSKTDQKFNDLNFGKSFPFKYDRRHVLSMTANYDLTKKWSLGSIFTYSSGAPLTLPTGRVAALNAGSIFEGNYFLYEGRNNFRMNPYHRLDLSASYHAPKRIFNRKTEIEWLFSIYNVYSRLNPYFVYLQLDVITNEPIAKQVSLLPIIPSISFNFKF